MAFNNIKTRQRSWQKQMIDRGDISTDTLPWLVRSGIFQRSSCHGVGVARANRAGSGSLGDLGSHVVSVALIMGTNI
ncbi:hypothetical protein LZ023_37795 (plasmid) [Pseudomonas silvicola]|nr:hypothetical protein LZ023_37795 [Pseudomonas silvicola]